MGDTYQNVDLTIQDILGLLKVVKSRTLRTSLNLVETRCDVCGGLGLCADGVEVGCGGVLSLGKRDELVASALDDGKRDRFSRHFYR